MALLQVGGVDIATPQDFRVSIADITKKAERNANGDVVIERLNTKRKLELRYAYLSQTDCATLLQAIQDVFFDVTYPDPQLGTTTTKTFYCSDRVIGQLDYQGSIPRYVDITFSFVEQ